MFIEGQIPNKFLEAAITTSPFGTGAQTHFVGRVRADKKENSKVEFIEFTAQRELALQVSQEIINESKDKFGIHNIEIWHSLGKIAAGKSCFLVTVCGAHRKESFKALEYIVNEVKKRCPIFGKEILKDGSILWKENIK